MFDTNKDGVTDFTKRINVFDSIIEPFGRGLYKSNAKNIIKNFDDVEWIWLDNTNCKDEDVKKYIDYADLYGYQVSFFRVDGEYESKAPSHIVKQQKEDLRKFNYLTKSEQLH